MFNMNEKDRKRNEKEDKVISILDDLRDLRDWGAKEPVFIAMLPTDKELHRLSRITQYEKVSLEDLDWNIKQYGRIRDNALIEKGVIIERRKRI